MQLTYKGYYLEDDVQFEVVRVYDTVEHWRGRMPVYNAHTEQEAHIWIDEHPLNEVADSNATIRDILGFINTPANMEPYKDSYYINDLGMMALTLIVAGSSIKGKMPPTTISLEELITEMIPMSTKRANEMMSRTVEEGGLESVCISLYKLHLEHPESRMVTAHLNILSILDLLIKNGIIGLITPTYYAWSTVTIYPAAIMRVLAEKGANSYDTSIQRKKIIDSVFEDSEVENETALQLIKANLNSAFDTLTHAEFVKAV